MSTQADLRAIEATAHIVHTATIDQFQGFTFSTSEQRRGICLPGEVQLLTPIPLPIRTLPPWRAHDPAKAV